MVVIITENAVEALKALPEGGAELILVIPPYEEDLPLDELVKWGYRALGRKGEIICARSLDAALAIL